MDHKKAVLKTMDKMCIIEILRELEAKNGEGEVSKLMLKTGIIEHLEGRSSDKLEEIFRDMDKTNEMSVSLIECLIISEFLNSLDCSSLSCEQVVAIIKDNRSDKSVLVNCVDRLNCIFEDDHQPHIRNAAAFVKDCTFFVDTAYTHSNDDHLVKLVLETIYKIARNDATSREFSKCGACEYLIHVLNIHLSNPEIAQRGCRAIQGLSVNKHIANKLTIDACRIVVAILKMHIDNTLVADQVFCTIKMMTAESVESRTIFGRSDACEAVISSIKIHMSNIDLLHTALEAIDTLAFKNPENVSRLQACGAYKVIIDAMRLTVRDFNMVELILGILSHFTVADNCSGCYVVVEGLQENIDDSIIAEHGCLAIGNLCTKNESNLNFLSVLTLHGVCDVVLSIMKRHKTDIKIVENACLALLNICYKNEMSVCRFNACGGCETILSVLKEHSRVLPVLEKASNLVANVALYADSSAALGSAGCCETLLSILDEHKNNYLIAGGCCLAIINLSRTNDDNIVKFCSRRGCDIIISLLKMHMSRADILESCLGFVTEFSGHSASERRFLTEDVYNTVIKILELRVHESNDSILQKACRLILTITSTVTNLRSNGSCFRLMLTLLKNHKSHANVVCQNVVLLVHICKSVDENQVKFGINGGHPLLVSLLNDHLDNPSVVEKLFCAIKAFSQNVYSRENFGASGACESVVSALEKHINFPDLVREGSSAIQSLSENSFRNKERFSACRCCEIISLGLSRHVNNVSVVEKVYLAIAALASNNENKIQLGACGACKAIVMALDVLVTDEMPNKDRMLLRATLISNGCGIIATLAFNNIRNSTSFGDCDGCLSVVSALRSYISHIDVAQNGCWALAILSSNYNDKKACDNENIRKIGLCGGCETLLSVLETHITDPFVAEYCSLAISHLSFNVDNKTALTKKLSIEAMLDKVLREHGRISKVRHSIETAKRELRTEGASKNLSSSDRKFGLSPQKINDFADTDHPFFKQSPVDSIGGRIFEDGIDDHSELTLTDSTLSPISKRDLSVNKI
jgi:hypothetical protein